MQYFCSTLPKLVEQPECATRDTVVEFFRQSWPIAAELSCLVLARFLHQLPEIPAWPPCAEASEGDCDDGAFYGGRLCK